MEYVSLFWRGPFTFERLERKNFGDNKQFNFYLLTTRNEYHELTIKYIGQTTQTILGRLKNHHKWEEIKETIDNPLRNRISQLIVEKIGLKLLIESLVERLEDRQTRIAQILKGLQEGNIRIFFGEGLKSNKPTRARVLEGFRSLPRNPTYYSINLDYDINPIENALIYAIKPEFNEKLKKKYQYPDRQFLIRNIGRHVYLDDIDTRKF